MREAPLEAKLVIKLFKSQLKRHFSSALFSIHLLLWPIGLMSKVREQ